MSASFLVFGASGGIGSVLPDTFDPGPPVVWDRGANSQGRHRNIHVRRPLCSNALAT